MGAYDGLFPAGFCLPDRHDGSEYIRGQPAFNFTRQFTLMDLVRIIEEARMDGKDHVYVKSDKRGISGVRLDLWYADALVRELCNQADEA